MSDLQCAATLLLSSAAQTEDDGSGAGLSLSGREQARDLGGSLRSARVALIYASDLPSAVQTAQIAAARLGVPVRVREALREWTPTTPDGESEAEACKRIAEELQAVVDAHRGETVLVVSHPGVLRTAVPVLATNLPDGFGNGRELSPCTLIEAAVDGDAWRVRCWAGSPV